MCLRGRRDPWPRVTIRIMPGCAARGTREIRGCRWFVRLAMDITILGRIGYDLYSEEPDVPLPQVRRFSRYLGGSSANMAVGLARLGARVGIVSCLGDDSISRFLIEFLQAEKVETTHVRTAPGFLP